MYVCVHIYIYICIRICVYIYIYIYIYFIYISHQMFPPCGSLEIWLLSQIWWLVILSSITITITITTIIITTTISTNNNNNFIIIIIITAPGLERGLLRTFAPKGFPLWTRSTEIYIRSLRQSDSCPEAGASGAPRYPLDILYPPNNNTHNHKQTLAILNPSGAHCLLSSPHRSSTVLSPGSSCTDSRPYAVQSV